jgi:hypothetical protein
MLIELLDGRYAFISAYTDHYTGFEIGGEVRVCISDKLATIIYGAMCEVNIRDLYQGNKTCIDST